MLLEVKNLSVGYEKKPIVENISFSLNEGEMISVVGENGSGKSTLVKTLLGIIKPICGEIIFSEELTNHRFGYLPQSNETQDDFPSNVFEIVISGTITNQKFKVFYNKEDRRIVNEKIELLKISKLIKKPFSILSGGQKQRVLIARALCATDKLLILDEPITGLDPDTTNEMYQIIKELKDSGISIIMISHDIEKVLEISDKILIISKTPKFLTKEEYLKEKNK